MSYEYRDGVVKVGQIQNLFWIRDKTAKGLNIDCEKKRRSQEYHQGLWTELPEDWTRD